MKIKLFLEAPLGTILEVEINIMIVTHTLVTFNAGVQTGEGHW